MSILKVKTPFTEVSSTEYCHHIYQIEALGRTYLFLHSLPFGDFSQLALPSRDQCMPVYKFDIKMVLILVLKRSYLMKFGIFLGNLNLQLGGANKPCPRTIFLCLHTIWIVECQTAENNTFYLIFMFSKNRPLG